MAARNLPPPLLYADSERNADPLYFGRVSVPDAFIAFGCRGKKYAVVSALEFGRVKRTSEFDVVLPLEAYLRKAGERSPKSRPGPAEVIAEVARELKQQRFTVPQDFPAGLYTKLIRLGLKVQIAEGPLFPEREIKSAQEADALREGNRCSAAGIAAVEKMLKASRIKGRTLVHRGKVVTSESLKIAAETACLEAGAVSLNTIIAGGDQACDPHESGSGPIRPNELIIVDIFPRVVRTGYYGDMTRTFLRGRASDAQRALVDAVHAAQRAALHTIRAGVDGREVHAQCTTVFADRGFETRHTPKGSVGFFHGTGHGVGLDIHEFPRVNATFEYKLAKGTVVTVEPGLYYPGLGGCRIEDVVQVKANGFAMLSSYPYKWELR
ncbi:MAG TPA: Xaa-Pro peptidase family protein [Opitutaceae bacterium]|nr:Xaa-Pro peptidase family protein [Opitutaceae bacterium]